MAPETELPEYMKAIVLQKIKAYKEKKLAKQARLLLLSKLATTETKLELEPKEQLTLQIDTQPKFQVEIRRKTPSNSQENSP
jgi:hypothetical protein